MKLSTNLPTSFSNLNEKVSSNIRKEADLAFLQELQESDPERYARLSKIIHKTTDEIYVGICSKCNTPISALPFLAEGATAGHANNELFCSRFCRDGENQAVARKPRKATRHFKLCKQCSTRFLAKRANQECCKPKCRLRWKRDSDKVFENRMKRESAKPILEAA